MNGLPARKRVQIRRPYVRCRVRERSTRHAFTLVELLVVIAVIGILIGLLSPSLQAMREASRRASCQSKLVPIGMAIQSYHDRWLHFPVGTVADSGPIENVASGNHHNWLGRLADLLDQPVIARRIDRSVSVYDAANADVLRLRFSPATCPSGASDPANASDYVGLHHPTEQPIDETNRGVFVLNVPIGRDEVTDGLSSTAFVSEKISGPGDLGWLSGTRATLRNVGGGIRTSAEDESNMTALSVGTIGSRHPGGAHLMLGSGEVRFMSTQTDSRILQQMIDRGDGQLPLMDQSIDELRRRSVQ